MHTTTHLKLGKPLGSEKYDIGIQNENMELLDTAIKALQDETAAKVSRPRQGVTGHVPLLAEEGAALMDSGFTIGTSVPDSAVFTDTVYHHPDYPTAAGTHTRVMVDRQGHVVQGESPTTLAGYGITDAATQSQGRKADTAVQSVKIGSIEYKSGTNVVLPAYPTSSDIARGLTRANITTALGYTPYTPNEVDNKLSLLETKIDWKEAVSTFSQIATTYPNPVDGWTVNVKDTDYTYRYNGSSWVAISANAIPKATNSVDGLLSKEDHIRYEAAYTQRHTHSNAQILNATTAVYTIAEKNKLSSIVSGAQVNQNAFSAVATGSTRIQANAPSDTLTLVAGENVMISGNANQKKVTIDVNIPIANNLNTATTGISLDATQGKVLDGKITSLETKLTGMITGLETKLTGVITGLETKLTGLITNLETKLTRLISSSLAWKIKQLHASFVKVGEELQLEVGELAQARECIVRIGIPTAGYTVTACHLPLNEYGVRFYGTNGTDRLYGYTYRSENTKIYATLDGLYGWNLAQVKVIDVLYR